MYDFKDKVALVTGAAQGIGKSYVQHLLEQHVKIMIVDINQTLGEKTRDEFTKKHGDSNIKFHFCDVTNEVQFEDAFKATIKEFGKLDILINNAGIARESEPDWRMTINTNFIGIVNGTQLGLKYMGKHEGHNGGTIINSAGITAFTEFECSPIVSATKAAVNQFSRSIGTKLHYNRTGVRVIAINPGITQTQILKDCYEHIIPEVKESFENAVYGVVIQSVDNMGEGLLELLGKAESGSIWVIEDNVAPKRVELKVLKF